MTPNEAWAHAQGIVRQHSILRTVPRRFWVRVLGEGSGGGFWGRVLGKGSEKGACYGVYSLKKKVSEKGSQKGF